MKRNAFSILCLGLLVLFIYSNSFRGSFHFDDYYYIVENLHIRDLSNLAAIGDALPKPSRYVPFLTFALNYRLHGLDVFGYHITNVFLHFLTTVLVWWFVRLLLSSPKIEHEWKGKPREAIALLTALLFAAHPLQTQAVNYLCQRFAVMATMFYMASLCFYLKGRLVPQKAFVYFIGCALSAILGMFSKQIVLTLPVAIVLTECFFFKAKTRMKWKYLFVILLFVLIIPTMYSFNVEGILSTQTESWSHRGDILTSRTYLLTQFRVIVTYLRLLFLPYKQNLLYDYPTSQSFFEFPTLVSFLFLLFILRLAFVLLSRQRLISFGIFWFFLTLSVESSVIVIKHVIFEHRCYLPSVGFSLVLCFGLFSLMKESRKFVVTLSMIVLTFSYLSFQRNKVWQTEISLWSDVIRKSPQKIRPYTHLATAYMKEGEFDLALIEFTNAINVKKDEGESYNNRGNVYMKMGRQDLALADYNMALELDPTLEKTYSNRGVIYSNREVLDLALKDFNMALKLNPENMAAYFNRGNVFFKQSQYDLALKDYSRALDLNPYYAAAYNQRGVVYGTKGRYDLAIKEFTNALKVNPEFSKAYWHRSITYQALGEYEKALEDALKARQLGRGIDQKYINALKSKIRDRR